MREINDRTILTLFIISILVSLSGAYFTINNLNKLNNLAGPTFSPITGFATSPNGTATLTVQTFSSIKFVTDTVAFGTGSVNTTGGFTNCTMDTYGNRTGCADFTRVGTPQTSAGFTVENDGNTNLTVELISNATATQFIGIGSAVFGWNVSVNESSSCKNTSTSTAPENNINPNTTADCGSSNTAGSACGAQFENVYTTGTTGKTVCPRLLYTDTSDSLRIDINVTIPYDAPTGAKSAKLTVTGTRHPTS